MKMKMKKLLFILISLFVVSTAFATTSMSASTNTNMTAEDGIGELRIIRTTDVGWGRLQLFIFQSDWDTLPYIEKGVRYLEVGGDEPNDVAYDTAYLGDAAQYFQYVELESGKTYDVSAYIITEAGTFYTPAFRITMK